MINAEDVQVMTGPSASWVHHLVGWVADVTGLNAVEALLVSGVGVVMGGLLTAAAVGTTLQRVVRAYHSE